MQTIWNLIEIVSLFLLGDSVGGEVKCQVIYFLIAFSSKGFNVSQNYSFSFAIRTKETFFYYFHNTKKWSGLKLVANKVGTTNILVSKSTPYSAFCVYREKATFVEITNLMIFQFDELMTKPGCKIWPLNRMASCGDFPVT